MKRYVPLVAMVVALMAVAHVIELTARPDSGRRPDSGATNVQVDSHAGHNH